jgi:integrase
MGKTVKLTQAKVSSFALPQGKSEHIEFDETLAGFGLRVRASGHKSFIAQYKIGGQSRRYPLGSTAELTADEARNGWKDQNGDWHDGAAQILAAAKRGTDLYLTRQSKRASASDTFGKLVAVYLAERAGKLRPSTLVAITHHLNALWLPLHTHPVAAVTLEHVAAQLSAIAKNNGDTASNRARASLSKFFVWAMQNGKCTSNPVINSAKKAEVTRERVLINIEEDHTIDWSELVAVWRALPENEYGNIVKLIALSGCRRDEIGSLEWDEIDFEKRMVTIPKDRTKNKTEHVAPLSDMALAILKAVPRRERKHVFGQGRGGFSGWSKAREALDSKVQLKAPWILHDIRRTVRTGLGALGVAPHVAEAVLNHLPAKLVRTYDRNTYAKEKRAALELWARELDVAIRRASGENVTTLRQA